jgi:hypothetical protein
MHRYVKLREVCADPASATIWSRFSPGGTDRGETLPPGQAVVSGGAEKLRVITVLMQDMDVNLAGVEVILHMREDLRSMRAQFDEILRVMVAELRRRIDT